MHRGENALHLGGSFWSLASKQPSGIWRKKCCQKSGTVRLTKGRAHRNMHQKRSPVVSLSTKRVTLLSPTFLKKGMSSPIAKFAHNGITGRSIEPVFALVLVTGMQGRGRSALEWPPSPCSALNECDLCRKNFFSTWIQELCVLSISALCCKVCPLTQGVHCQPQWWIVSPLCVCFLLSKNGDKDISFLSLQNTATVLDGQCIRRLQYHCCCKQCCFFVPKYRRQVFLGGFWVEKKSKTAYLNDNYALLILQITAKMSVFFSSSSLVG